MSTIWSKPAWEKTTLFRIASIGEGKDSVQKKKYTGEIKLADNKYRTNLKLSQWQITTTSTWNKDESKAREAADWGGGGEKERGRKIRRRLERNRGEKRKRKRERDAERDREQKEKRESRQKTGRESKKDSYARFLLLLYKSNFYVHVGVNELMSTWIYFYKK